MLDGIPIVRTGPVREQTHECSFGSLKFPYTVIYSKTLQYFHISKYLIHHILLLTNRTQ